MQAANNPLAVTFFFVFMALTLGITAATERDGPRAAAVAAMKTLLDVGRFEVAIRNKRRLTVIVRNERGKSVYRTEMALEADWLSDEGRPQVSAE
ncbi:hypothetical protein Mpop_1562 [Methylorubrum populi BJ001]|jgi:hypothetical protein|uniref:Uncharacterized protein n=2 Tax=Methylobacteriaceae TaxID=119045 RepID=B1ZFF8_METPB|nr:hypothetical protein [Methylorubrum populi]ACB79728.1 hypothetical protein Mpop_1562 [Methylorubrum populi BJ001]